MPIGSDGAPDGAAAPVSELSPSFEVAVASRKRRFAARADDRSFGFGRGPSPSSRAFSVDAGSVQDTALSCGLKFFGETGGGDLSVLREVGGGGPLLFVRDAVGADIVVVDDALTDGAGALPTVGDAVGKGRAPVAVAGKGGGVFIGSTDGDL